MEDETITNAKEINYKELVNPTFTTGQATLEMLAAAGNPDAVAYKELLDERSEKDSYCDLVFNFEHLEYLSSTGLRILLMMAKRLGNGHLFVDNANAVVQEIFETTGFMDVVTVR